MHKDILGNLHEQINKDKSTRIQCSSFYYEFLLLPRCWEIFYMSFMHGIYRSFLSVYTFHTCVNTEVKLTSPNPPFPNTLYWRNVFFVTGCLFMKERQKDIISYRNHITGFINSIKITGDIWAPKSNIWAPNVFLHVSSFMPDFIQARVFLLLRQILKTSFRGNECKWTAGSGVHIWFA